MLCLLFLPFSADFVAIRQLVTVTKFWLKMDVMLVVLICQQLWFIIWSIFLAQMKILKLTELLWHFIFRDEWDNMLIINHLLTGFLVILFSSQLKIEGLYLPRDLCTFLSNHLLFMVCLQFSLKIFSIFKCCWIAL